MNFSPSQFCSILLATISALSFGGCSKSSPELEKKTLNLVSISKVKGLDPITADDLYSGRETQRVHEGLYEYHYLKRPYELIPMLAESMPVISKDGKTITIKLKKGVFFQDNPAFPGGKGREFVAADAIYSWMRIADPKNVSPLWWLFDGKIVGLNEWAEDARASGKSDYDKPVEGLKALDANTLQIKLKNRSYQFVYTLAMPGASVVAREAVEKYGVEYLSHPVGTGPYQVLEYSAGSKISYIKNPTYREAFYPSEGAKGDAEKGLLKDAGKRLPLTERVTLHIIVEDQPRWLGFLQGKYDAMGVPKDNYAQVFPTQDPEKLSAEILSKKMKLSRDPQMEFTRTSFNMDDPLLGKNKFLRQAIATAIDQKEFNRLFYNSQALIAQGPIPPGLDGYDPDFVNPYRKFDLNRAKALLAKAGYPGGKGLPEIRYIHTASTTARQINEFEAKCLAEIGVKIKSESYTWPEFQQKIKNRDGQMWGFAWGADYPDAENFLQLFYSKNRSPGPNDSGFNNKEYDAMYEQSLILPPGALRTALYKKMFMMVVEEVPSIPGAHRIAVYLTQPWVYNFQVAEFDHPFAKYYRVDEAEKAIFLGIK